MPPTRQRFLPGLITGLAASCALAVADPAATGRISLRPTHAAVAQKQAGGPVVRAANPITLKPASNPLRETLPDIMERSTVICGTNCWTIVPKHAVLSVPPRYRARIDAAPRGELLPWNEFHRRNRGWIHRQEVRMSDARGVTSLGPEVLATHARSGRVVVAVRNGGPISVRPTGNGTTPTASTNR